MKIPAKAWQNVLTAVREIFRRVLSRQNFQSEIDGGRMPRRYDDKDAAWREHALYLNASSFQVENEFKRAYGNNRVEKRVLVGHGFRASGRELCRYTVFSKDIADGLRVVVGIDPIKLVAMERQFGHEYAATKADLKKAMVSLTFQQGTNELKPQSLDLAQHRAVVPRRMINIPRL